MRGSWEPWRFVHCRQHRLRPKDRFALTEPMCGIPAQFLSTHQSVRLYGTISTIFSNREPCAEYPLSLSTHQSVRLHGITHRLFFSGRSSNETASMGTRFSVRVIAHERHFCCRASAYSSNFCNAITLELRASWLAGDPHGPREAFFVFFFFLLWFCMVLYQVQISTVLLLPDQHKPL